MNKIRFLTVVMILLTVNAVPIATAASGADVIVTQLSYANGIFTSMVKNQGTAATPAGVSIGVGYSVNGVQRTWGAVTGPLAAGASVTIGTNGGSYTIPTGTHTMMAWVDDNNRFAESVETNNQLSQSVTIGTTITQAPTVPNDSTVQGFAAAAGVTGGAGGQDIVVTNLNESGTGSLHAAIYTPGTRNIKFQPGLSGVITFTAAHYIPYGNMTIDGAGANITISGYNLNIFKPSETPVENIIIKNLRFVNTQPMRSAIVIQFGSYDIWIDHCTFRNNSRSDANGVVLNGQAITIWDLGRGDGGLDGITLSWNKFEAPNIKAVLIASQNDSIHLSTKVSLHHNWFDNIIARSPRLGAVTAHMWNNYTSNWGEYGTAISGAGDLLAQNNIYEKSNGGKAIDANYGNLNSNSVNATGNLRLGNPLPVIETLGTFPMSQITYSVTPEVANDALKQRLIAGAGAH